MVFVTIDGVRFITYHLFETFIYNKCIITDCINAWVYQSISNQPIFNITVIILTWIRRHGFERPLNLLQQELFCFGVFYAEETT